jgi:hypothetical protein
MVKKALQFHDFRRIYEKIRVFGGFYRYFAFGCAAFSRTETGESASAVR